MNLFLVLNETNMRTAQADNKIFIVTELLRFPCG
jgi:hypothetical protein